MHQAPQSLLLPRSGTRGTNQLLSVLARGCQFVLHKRLPYCIVLQGKIPFYLLNLVGDAFLVSCFHTLLCNFNTEPLIAWAECQAAEGTGLGLSK